MSDINSYLATLAKRLSVTKEEREKIDTSINYLKGKIWERFQDRLSKVEVFGSYDRGTSLSPAIDQNADVDILVIFKTNDYQPNTFLNHLNEFAKNLYQRSDVSPDHPAITIELDHVKFELVPAYWEENTFSANDLMIPAPRNKEIRWIETEPQQLKEDLEAKNNMENQMITPLIKLIKYLNYRHGKPYDSYVIEKFAISRSYPDKELKNYLYEFINDLDTDDQTEMQIAFINELKLRRENLLNLEKNHLTDYIEQELQKFLPMP